MLHSGVFTGFFFFNAFSSFAEIFNFYFLEHTKHGYFKVQVCQLSFVCPMSPFVLEVIFLGFELYLVFSYHHVITGTPGSAKVYQSQQTSSIICVLSDLCSYYQKLGGKGKCFANVPFSVQMDFT